MEVLPSSSTEVLVQEESTTTPFIISNTIGSSLKEIRKDHIIPVFVKDNEPVISQADFISLTLEAVNKRYERETILTPSVRLSHPIKGRTPSAKDKPANMLKESEKTIYYERMAFIIEVPTITDTIGGNTLSLTIGGVKAHNLDNLYNKKGADEHFKIFIGFQNKVCTNLCVSTDGLVADLKVKNAKQLADAIDELINRYNAQSHLISMARLNQHTLTEQQFAHLIGKCKMYPFLPVGIRKEIPFLQFGDNLTGIVVKDYYQDSSFCRNDNGDISLWNLYNLFTGSNKSSYIDAFLDRGLNAFQFTEGIADALEHKQLHWFLQ